MAKNWTSFWMYNGSGSLRDTKLGVTAHICTWEDIVAGVLREGSNQALILVQMLPVRPLDDNNRRKDPKYPGGQLAQGRRARIKDERLMPMFVVWAPSWWGRGVGDKKWRAGFWENVISVLGYAEFELHSCNKLVGVSTANGNADLTECQCVSRVAVYQVNLSWPEGKRRARYQKSYLVTTQWPWNHSNWRSWSQHCKPTRVVLSHRAGFICHIRDGHLIARVIAKSWL